MQKNMKIRMIIQNYTPHKITKLNEIIKSL